MITAGIVAEYNPFHNGHKYHMEKTREITGADCITAVMSGSFVQRGEPAVFSKHARAASAVDAGADLVFELPAYYSLQSAEGFAAGAVAILKEIGCNYISFGAESECIDDIRFAASCLINETDEFKRLISDRLKCGESYAAAREHTACEVFGISRDLLRAPNNILAVEYVKAILRCGHFAEPVAVKRIGAKHDSSEVSGSFAGASHIRELIFEGKMYDAYSGFKTDETPVSIYDFEKLILYAVKMTDCAGITDLSDGLYERLLAADANSLDGLLAQLKTKRHTLSRIKRALMNVLIGNNIKRGLSPSYLRVLAANKRGCEKLSELRDTCSLPIITKPAAYKENDPMWELEKRATAVRGIVTNGFSEERLSPVIRA